MRSHDTGSYQSPVYVVNSQLPKFKKSFIIQQEISVCLEVEVGYLSAKISEKVKIKSRQPLFGD